MLIDIISTSNYNSYNIKLANMFGLDCAVYLNELINICEKAVRKDKITDCFFDVDRSYVESRTTIKETSQISLDEKLEKVGIVSRKKDCPNRIKIDLVLLTNIMSSEDEDLKNGLVKLVELKGKKQKPTKQEKIAQDLKDFVNTGNTVLDDFMRDWVDSVISKQGWLSKSAIIDCQEKINAFAFPDINKAIEVVKIAAVNGWRDVSWAINKYKESHKGENHLTFNDQDININTDVTFK